MRRSRLRLSRADRMKSAKRRDGAPLSRLSASASARGSATCAADGRCAPGRTGNRRRSPDAAAPPEGGDRTKRPAASSSSNHNCREKKPPLLRPVNRIVRRIEIQTRPIRSRLMRIQEQRHQQIRFADPSWAILPSPDGDEPPNSNRLGVDFLATGAQFRRSARNFPARTAIVGPPRSTSRSIESSWPNAIPNARCPTSVRTECSTNRASRRSSKQAARRSASPITAFACPSGGAPASEVTDPPSKSTATARLEAA